MALLSNIKLVAIGLLGVATVSLYLLWSSAATDLAKAQEQVKSLSSQLKDFEDKQKRLNTNTDTRAREEKALEEAIGEARKRLENDHPESKDTPISDSTRDALEWLRNRTPE